jgi:urease accessory protein
VRKIILRIREKPIPGRDGCNVSIALMPHRGATVRRRDAAVSITLVVVGLVLLERLPALLLVPAFALHGYVLSAAVIGWEQSPIAFYLVGLLVSQGLLLTTSLTLVRRWGTGLSASQLRLTAGILIGVGSSFAWSALVP